MPLTAQAQPDTSRTQCTCCTAADLYHSSSSTDYALGPSATCAHGISPWKASASWAGTRKRWSDCTRHLSPSHDGSALREPATALRRTCAVELRLKNRSSASHGNIACARKEHRRGQRAGQYGVAPNEVHQGQTSDLWKAGFRESIQLKRGTSTPKLGRMSATPTATAIALAATESLRCIPGRPLQSSSEAVPMKSV
jgi:hypothetical protein